MDTCPTGEAAVLEKQAMKDVQAEGAGRALKVIPSEGGLACEW